MGGRVVNPGSAGETEVRSFARQQEQNSAPAADVRDTEHKRSPVVDLMEKLAQREAEISLHADALADAREQGAADGRAEAEDAFEDSREAALAALKDGLIEARAALASRLEGFETMAVELAAATVEQLTGDADAFREMVGSAIRRELAPMAGETVLTVSVSRIDFPDTREVAALSGKIALAGERLVVSDDLEAGQCRIQLEVGALEIDLKRHWRDLRVVLHEDEGRASS